VEPITSSAERIIASNLRRAPAGEAPLLAWPLACGSTVAARTRAIEFCGGILKVEVPDVGWRSELQHLAPRYVAALNRYGVAVSRVEFIVRAKPATVADASQLRKSS
jgi:Dna[CI] antecedent, DciA